MSQSDNLAKARADKRELAWVRKRRGETEEDRKRLAAHLESAEKARDYEQADVDALTHGVGSFFRRLMADHTDLSKEQQELAAAQLLCDELSEEMRAIDVDLKQLAAREAAVANADERYTRALADAEAEVRARGEPQPELDTLAEAEGELTAHRREVREAMTAGIAAQKTFLAIVTLVRELQPNRHHEVEPMAGEHLVRALTGWSREKYQDLTSAIANAQQGLRSFAQVCGSLASALPAGLDLDLRLEPLPPIGRLVLRDVLWTNGLMLEAILPEVSRVSSSLSTAVGELKSRDNALAQALGECSRMRARLLDPTDD